MKNNFVKNLVLLSLCLTLLVPIVNNLNIQTDTATYAYTNRVACIRVRHSVTSTCMIKLPQSTLVGVLQGNNGGFTQVQYINGENTYVGYIVSTYLYLVYDY